MRALPPHLRPSWSALALASAIVLPTVVVPLAAAPATDDAARASGQIRPIIVQRRIPFPDSRKRQTARYSKRHYGERSWRLDPRGIVQHYTGTDSLQSVLATFAGNSADPELGERPGVCTHFVIDTDGTVYQTVATSIRCRHTVGLNHRMIGVEHVGTSDAAVMGNRAQLRASLALSAWLVRRFGLTTGDVIGHNENVASRFHRERYGPWRCQTHADFARATMRRYRSLLNRRVARFGGATAAPDWRRSDC